MKMVVRVLAVLNALFAGIVGIMCVVTPHLAAASFGLAVTGREMVALIRMFGALLGSTGMISLLIARNPNRDPGMVASFAGILLFNIGADVIVISAGELRFDQLAIGMIFQVALAIALLIARRA